ncbi:MAG: glutathione S-transferase family protein [Alphaproteobacteria bacterium]|jgi:glutathione S-transferase|nr:glutathione S-transferase family protein [Alphaproteobacteria bacterium]
MTFALYHLPLSASCRFVRLLLAEKRLPFDLHDEKVWEGREEFLALSPAGEVPVLVEPGGLAVTGAWVISEILEETHPEPTLLGTGRAERVEARRLLAWFEGPFAREVTDLLVGEKVMKRLFGHGQPDSEAIRIGLGCMRDHLAYVDALAERRRWLAGDRLTVADLAAAAHLSAVDYLGNVPWADFEEARLWYARIKSRPGFRPLLTDRVPGLLPAAHYENLDF